MILSPLISIFLGDLPETVEVLDLGFQGVISTIKPEPPVSVLVYSQGSANGVAKFTASNGVMLGKYLDAVGQTRALHWNAQLHSEIVAKRGILWPTMALPFNRHLLPAIWLVFAISPHGFRMWVSLDNPEICRDRARC